MATKRQGNPSYDKADMDEPLFVLRAKDITAPAIVRHWADVAALLDVPAAKVAEAQACADAMEQWQIHNTFKVPD